MMPRFSSLLFLLAVACGLAATPSSGLAGRESSLPQGLFRLESGEYLLLWRNEEQKPMAGLPGGRVRALFPDDSGAHYGPSLGVGEPAQGWIRPAPSGQHDGESVQWQHGDASARKATRVALREESVSFASRGIQLSGTAIFPPGPGPFACVVFTHGSGPQSRDSGTPIAYSLASRGIACLLFDKAGSGNTRGGDPRDRFDDLASDALAAVTTMKARTDVRANQVGLFGPSQGSWVSVLAAARSSDVAFVLLQSGDATPPLEQEMYRGAGLLRASGKLTEAEVLEAVRFRRSKFEFVVNGGDRRALAAATEAARPAKWFGFVGSALPDTVFWRVNGGFDPLPHLEALHCPVLAVFGARDASKDVPLNAALMRAAFMRSGNPDATVLVFPNANHGLFETLTGEPLEREFARLDRIAPGYPDTLANWVLRHTR